MLVKVVAVLVMVAGTGACSPGDAMDAVGLLRDVGGSPSQAGVARAEISWRAEGEDQAGDLYTPVDDAPRAALVLVPGLAPEGRNDRRLVAFATALTRRGFVVLVPDMPGLRAQRVTAADSVPIAAALRHLRARRGGSGLVGVAAISYAVGPAILATLTPQPEGPADFVVAVGGYFDTLAVTTFFTTGYFRDGPDSPWQHAQPNAFGKWVFVLANAERLEDAADRSSLSAIARRKLADLNAEIGDLVPGLRQEGRAVMALLANNDPARVPDLVAALPAPLRADLEGLNLKGRDLSASKAQFILLHGRDDAIIPYTESVALAAALPPGRVQLVLLDSFAHAELSAGGAADAVRLWRGAYALMQLRGGGGAEPP